MRALPLDRGGPVRPDQESVSLFGAEYSWTPPATPILGGSVHAVLGLCNSLYLFLIVLTCRSFPSPKEALRGTFLSFRGLRKRRRSNKDNGKVPSDKDRSMLSEKESQSKVLRKEGFSSMNRVKSAATFQRGSWRREFARGLGLCAASLLLATYFTTLSSALSTVRESGVGRERGQQYPDIVLPALDGSGPLSISHFRGRKVILLQFASW